jgi:hypothetical protein
MLVSIVSMLVGLIRSTSADRVHEDWTEYKADNRRLTDKDYDLRKGPQQNGHAPCFFLTPHRPAYPLYCRGNGFT